MLMGKFMVDGLLTSDSQLPRYPKEPRVHAGDGLAVPIDGHFIGADNQSAHSPALQIAVRVTDGAPGAGPGCAAVTGAALRDRKDPPPPDVRHLHDLCHRYQRVRSNPARARNAGMTR